MIQVNLLPAEMRKPEGTPMARFMIIIGDVVVISMAICAFLYLRSVQLPEAEKDRSEMESQVALAKRKSAKYDKLKQAKQSFERRKDTFQQIVGERVLWSKKLAQLSQIVGARPLWLNDLKVTSSRGRTGGIINKISTKLETARRDERIYADYRQALRANKEYWNDFLRLTESGQALTKGQFIREDGGRTRVYKEEEFFRYDLSQIMKEVGMPKPKKKPKLPGVK